jgi:DNA polymerase III epsilon subunit-like protein
MINRENITFFDLETTGLSTDKDKIVSIYAVNPRKKFEIHTILDPEVLITPELTAIHGIDNKIVKGKPKFIHVAPTIKSMFESSDYLAGYNIRKFDIPFIQSMFQRENEEFNIEELKYIDVYLIAVNIIPESDLKALPDTKLKSVYKYITGEELDAHRAKNDVIACIEILEEFDRQKLNWRGLILSKEDLPDYEISNLDYIMKYGKHKGSTIREIISNDKSYAKWMVDKRMIKLSSDLLTLIKK